jgi:hypothetical protein
MNDLDLWRRLRRPFPQADEILPPLRELADLPLDQRVAFLGLLSGPLAHTDSRVRAAALLALGGARGVPALQWLVSGLGDAEGEVRLAAAEGLRRSLLDGDWPRWAHTLFHPDAAVRQAAVAEGSPFPPPRWHKLYLLADPACNEAVFRELSRLDLSEAGYAILPVLREYAGQSEPLRTQALALLFRIPPELTLDWHLQFPSRAADAIEQLATGIPGPDEQALAVAHAGRDFLDDFLSLVWSPDAPPGYVRRLADVLVERLAGSADLRPRVLAALLLAAVRRGWSAELLGLCAGCRPGLLLSEAIPPDVRRAALPLLRRFGAGCPKLSDREVRDLARGPLCLRPDGSPDLEALGCLLHLVAENPFHRAGLWFTPPELVRAIAEQEAQVIPFFSVPGGYHAQARADWVARLCREVEAPRSPTVLALLLWAAPNQNRTILEPVDGPTAAAMLPILLELTERPLFQLSRGRSEGIGSFLAYRLQDPAHIEAFLLAPGRRRAPADRSAGAGGPGGPDHPPEHPGAVPAGGHAEQQPGVAAGGRGRRPGPHLGELTLRGRPQVGPRPAAPGDGVRPGERLAAGAAARPAGRRADPRLDRP